MDIGPYFQNVPIDVTVHFNGGTLSSLAGELVAHDSHGLVIEDEVDLNFVPWSAVSVLSADKKTVAVPAPLQK